MTALETVYVTVGTTTFDALIREVTSDKVLKVLKSRGCRRLTLQLGRGRGPVSAEEIYNDFGILVEQYDFKIEPVRTDVLQAKLVIGHAGAGTCMDILNAQKPGLIVINEALMDNHQAELALQLAKEGYLKCCQVGALKECLENFDIASLKPYKSTAAENMKNFVRYLDEFINKSN